MKFIYLHEVRCVYQVKIYCVVNRFRNYYYLFKLQMGFYPVAVVLQ
jgi:hypothetical protein